MHPFQPPKKYPLIFEDKHELMQLQGFLCAICGIDGKLVIDHDHDTGFVRGALCHDCNVGLGWFKDSQNFLMAAIGYLAMAQVVRETYNAEQYKDKLWKKLRS
jgi:hypothetical protein